MSLDSAPPHLGMEGGMGEVTQKGKEKGHVFWKVTPQPGNFRWEKAQLGRDMLEVWKMMARSEQGTNLMIGDVFRRSGRRGFLLQDGKFLDHKNFVC